MQRVLRGSSVWVGRRQWQQERRNGSESMRLRNCIAGYFEMSSFESIAIPSHHYAFAIDIDGTIVKGQKALPRATQALNLLASNNIPYVLITNNLSKSPHEKAFKLNQILQLSKPITPEQVILNYTPILSYNIWKDQIVMLVGRQNVLDKVLPLPQIPKYITVEEYASIYPECVPLGQRVFGEEQNKLKTIIAGRLGTEVQTMTRDWMNGAVEAVMVLSTPRRWEESYQVLLDVLGPRAEKVKPGAVEEPDAPEDARKILIKSAKYIYNTLKNLSRKEILAPQESLLSQEGSLHVLQESMLSHQPTYIANEQSEIKVLPSRMISPSYISKETTFKLIPGTYTKIRRGSAYFETSYCDIQGMSEQNLKDKFMNVNVGQIAQIPVIVALNDMFTSSQSHPLPRILIKPFNDGLKSLYEQVYKQELQVLHYGKPESNTFHYVRLHMEKIHGPIDKIIMVGDNEDSDIVGASSIGWDSILVMTGVTQRISKYATVCSSGIYEGIISYFVREGVLDKHQAHEDSMEMDCYLDDNQMLEGGGTAHISGKIYSRKVVKGVDETEGDWECVPEKKSKK